MIITLNRNVPTDLSTLTIHLVVNLFGKYNNKQL